MKINYTSKNTSVNAKRIPKGFSLLYPYGNVLDYGCGKYTKHVQEFCEEKGATYYRYDKYNIPEIENLVSLGRSSYYNTIYCNNVLNVIYDSYLIIEIIENIVDVLAENGTAIFTIYEGDKSGIGKESKPDCWQRNEKTKDYAMFFEYADTKNCIITISNDKILMKKLDRKTAKELSEYLNDYNESPF